MPAPLVARLQAAWSLLRLPALSPARLLTLARLLDAVLALSGAVAVVIGVAQIYLPAAWIVGGIGLLALGLLPMRSR